MLSRTIPAIGLGSGGVVILLIGVLALFGVGTVASAEPAQQAAGATSTPVGAAQSSCTPAQAIQLVLANPQPGDTLLSGVPVNMSGIAYDTASTSGSGVASVTVYLGDRDAGGLSLGIASLGQPNPDAPAGSQFATAGFKLRTPPLPSGTGSRTVFVYARSAITDAERVLQVPVFLNTAPTPVKKDVPTAVVAAAPACTPTPVPTATPTAIAASAAAAPTGVPTVGVPPTLLPAPTLALPGPAAPAAPAAAPAPPAAAPAAATPPAPVATAASAAAQTTAPRGGGIPSPVGLGLVTAGALILGAGVMVRRRQRRIAAVEADSASGS